MRTGHPTTKPVALIADALLDSTTKGEPVLDQFAGSGTTILAAEKVGRMAYAMEFEPRYVDAAVGRWQQMTNLEATLAGDGRTFEEIATARGGAAQSHGSGLARRQTNQGGRLRSTRDRSPDRAGRDSEGRHG
jgi:DNA methylase